MGDKIIQQDQPKQQRFSASRLSIKDEPTSNLARTTKEHWSKVETELLTSPCVAPKKGYISQSE